MGPLFYFIKPYPKYIVAMLALILLSAVFEGANVVVLFGLLKTILTSSSNVGVQNPIMTAVFNVINAIPVRDKIVAASIFMITVIIIKSVFTFLQQIFAHYVGYRIWYDVQKNVFAKYVNADYQYYLDHKQGELIFKAYSAPASMGGVLQYTAEALSLIVQLIAIGCVLLVISPSIAPVIFLFGGVFYFFTNFVARRISYHLGRGRTEASQRQNMLLAEFINGIKQIKVFLSEQRWFAEYVKAMRKYFRLAFKDRIWQELPQHVLEILAVAMLCALILALKAFNPQGFVSQLSLLGAFAYAF